MIATQETKIFPEGELFNNPPRKEQFVRDMQGHGGRSLERYTEWFDIFAVTFFCTLLPTTLYDNLIRRIKQCQIQS